MSYLLRIGMYELWLFVEQPENDTSFKETLSNTLKNVKLRLPLSKICGAFQSEFGNSNSTVVIWQHESFDNTKALRKEWKIQGNDFHFLCDIQILTIY